MTITAWGCASRSPRSAACRSASTIPAACARPSPSTSGSSRGWRSSKRRLLEPDVLEGRGVEVVRDEAEARLGHAGADAVQEGRLEQRQENPPLVHELLDLFQGRLPLLSGRL